MLDIEAGIYVDAMSLERCTVSEYVLCLVYLGAAMVALKGFQCGVNKLASMHINQRTD